MSLGSDDTPTGPIAGAQPQQGQSGQLTLDLAHRRNMVRDLTGGALLVLAVFFPWNLYFGFRIPGSSNYVLAVLLAVTLLSLIAIAVPYVGPWRLSGTRFAPTATNRLRLGLNIPYLLLLLAFVVYDIFQTIRSGGTVNVPGGVGPGGWLGIAGAMLCAQPVSTGQPGDNENYDNWLFTARILGYASMFGAALSSGFNLAWRVRYALQPTNSASGFGRQNISVIDTALVYGVVALVAVLVASRWLLKGTREYQLPTIALGASAMVAGIIVWVLPVGREIDAFHGIAQNTSTAGVGYEGYLVWAAGAAIFAPMALVRSHTHPIGRDIWRAAARNGLLLIAVWCLGSVVMRLTDLSTAVMLNFPYSRYDTMTLAAFDLVTAALAFWLRINLVNQALPARLISSLCGFLLTLTVSRVIVGVVLAPRFAASPDARPNPVYGNNLAQQITSTFDVTLCGLALGIVVAVIISGRRSATQTKQPGRPRRRQRRTGQPGPARGGAAVPSEAETTQFRSPAALDAHDDAPTTVLSGPGRAPRIFRSGESTGPLPPKIYRRPDDPS
ncbi:hypothetical protein NJB18091_47160 [Mycobacterium marinum]|uniref:DUF7937 domain-containing protein n=1 Tax=Mycobacterium marinum TaxID=1781 RepID=UPI0021C28FEF|nr:hypothetical protein [Mycobacterium marinum]GJO06308.1 hypothetical protein NJB18091_47160 [Mycobacterium marinum]